MYDVSSQAVDEHMINVHYYYYYFDPGDYTRCSGHSPAVGDLVRQRLPWQLRGLDFITDLVNCIGAVVVHGGHVDARKTL